MNNDHRNNIYEAAKRLTDGLRAALDHESGDCDACAEDRCDWQDDEDCYPTDEVFLDTEVFSSRSDSERRIVTFLLGCGGPTTDVTVDQAGHVEFFHSWGKGRNDEDLTTITLYDDEADVWRHAAEREAERFA